MATVTEYTGNAGLGFGSNPNIGVDVINLSGVNQAIRDVQLADIDQNNRIFQQRLKDRDNLYQMLATNQIASGKISDKDRPVFDEAQKRQQEAWSAIQGANDAKGYENYYKALNDLRNITTQAQARYVGLTELQKEAASKTLPSEQKALSEHLTKQEEKPFWDTVDPFQQTLKNDFEGMKAKALQGALLGGNGLPLTQTKDTLTTTNRNGKTTVTNTQTTAPVTGKQAVSRGTVSMGANGQLSPVTSTTTYYDYPTIRRNSMEANVSDEAQQIYQQRWRETFENQDPNTFTKNIDLFNQRIREYNTQRGLTDKDQGFVTDIQYIVNPQTGKIQISETNPDFLAKTTLGSIDGPYKSTTQAFDKDIAKYITDQQENAIKSLTARTAQQRANAYSKFVDFKTQDPQAGEGIQIWNSLVDKVVPNALSVSNSNALDVGQYSPTRGFGVNKADVIWADELPQGFKNVAGVGYGKDARGNSNGKPMAIELAPKISGGRPYYNVSYYDLNGNKADKSNKALKAGYEAVKQSGFAGSFEDFIKLQVKRNALQMELEGQNGRANAISAITSQRAINAEATTKGEEGIFSSVPE